jgi:hypothetical protein
MVRSHLEYANSVWAPIRKTDQDKLEKVQMRATKIIHGHANKTYSSRLKFLNLPTLKYRQVRGEMIELFKIVTGIYDTKCSLYLDFYQQNDNHPATRDHRYKIAQQGCRYDMRKHFFINRSVPIWNSLPDSVVSAETINTFKNRLDKFWEKQPFKYDPTFEILGTGNRSFV